MVDVVVEGLVTADLWENVDHVVQYYQAGYETAGVASTAVGWLVLLYVDVLGIRDAAELSHLSYGC